MVLFIAVITVINVMALLRQDRQDFLEDITVKVNDEKATEVDVTLFDFCPGDKKISKIHLKNSDTESYNLFMKFKKSGVDTLSPFIDVTLVMGNGEELTKTLKELLEFGEIVIPLSEEQGSELEIQIIYSMSLDTGDEAQLTKADFDILIYAKA